MDQHTKYSTKNPFVPQGCHVKSSFLGKSHYKQLRCLTHLLQAAALPGGDLRVGPERLAKLLNAACCH